MIDRLLVFLTEGLDTLNQVLEAGIAITAFSLFLRALTFNLRDRVTRSFAIILACIVVMYGGESMAGVNDSLLGLEFWLHFQWLGIVLLPAAYLHFTDALIATTGQPSRGRRLFIVRLAYLLSAALWVTLPMSLLVGEVVLDSGSLPHLQPTPLSTAFTVYYFLTMTLAGVGMGRAYRRTLLKASRRRMSFLWAGAVFLAIGSYPYLLYGSRLAVGAPAVFLLLATVGNILAFWALIAMAYAVAFFGVPWPDRIVKSRLLNWLLRGPVTVFIVLALITSVQRVGGWLGAPNTVAIPVITVITVLLLEHLITLLAPFWERWFFHGGDRRDFGLLQTLEERMLTRGDLRQFLEMVLASVCDRFRVSTAFVAALSDEGLEMVVQVGKGSILRREELSDNLLEAVVGAKNGQQGLFSWGEFWLLPLYGSGDNLLGLLGILRQDGVEVDEDQREYLSTVGERASMALENRRMQQQIILSLEALNPRVELVQRLRAAARYDQTEILANPDKLPRPVDLNRWVKDALSHYWGGPKLTESPLMRLEIVQKALAEHDGNPTNALRAILVQAVEQTRPEGERRFTGDWLLYNILEMKFIQGRKVREIAMRLAMSEADLYRKQRIAIEEVAKAIVEMELTALQPKAQAFSK